MSLQSETPAEALSHARGLLANRREQVRRAGYHPDRIAAFLADIPKADRAAVAQALAGEVPGAVVGAKEGTRTHRLLIEARLTQPELEQLRAELKAERNEPH